MSDIRKQLYKKSSDGTYPKIFPLAFIQGIKDKRNNKELLSYINEINHFKVDYTENPETTRCQVDNFIRKNYSDRAQFKNKNNLVTSKINNKLDNKYDDNDIIENDDEFNIDDSLKNFHIEKSSNVRTLILNDDKIKRNTYINSKNITLNNEDNIHNNKTKNIIYITKAQNENFKKYLERRIFGL